MKSFLSVLIFSLCLFSPFAAAAEQPQTVRMVSTIGPVSSGVLEALAKAFTAKTGIAWTFEGAGTGAALDKARKGNVDIVLVHALKLEEKFMAEGYGLDRRALMYNDFVILGPKSDPAKITGLSDVGEALKKIASGKHLFVTRGDRSGTHVAELELWEAAGITIPADAKANFDKAAFSWYDFCPVGDKGNGPTAKYANEKQAYLVVERATWLAVKKDVTLGLLMQGDKRMVNFMSVISVNPQKASGVNPGLAKALADWLVSDEAQGIIKTFGVDKYGEPLFFPNSDQWRAKQKK